MNILIFGPNGSGKGTQAGLIKDVYSLDHIESGDIFREHIERGSELGVKAEAYIDRGDLVPDEITIPLVLETLDGAKENGWLLDGFPRNLDQAISLSDSLVKSGENIDFVIEIKLDRAEAKKRIMGRRICTNASNHPNNIYIPSIRPKDNLCRVCGGALKTRADDQDEEALNRRQDIYYDTENGTLAAAEYFSENCSAKYIQINGCKEIEEIKDELLSQIG